MDEKNTNVFGQQLKDGQVMEPTAPQASTDKKPDDKKPAATEDIEKNPLVIELRKEIENVKKNYGGNLTAQRDKIDRLEKKIDNLTKPKEDKPKPLFETILRVKDLPKEERDAMTETERRLFDENADMKVRLNEIHAAGQSKEPANTDDGDDKQFDVNTSVQAEAMKLADGNYTKAQELIGKFNTLGFDLTQITSENVAERVASVAALIPDWKPKKEQEGTSGGAVKTNGVTSSVDAAVTAAAKEREEASAGNYSL